MAPHIPPGRRCAFTDMGRRSAWAAVQVRAYGRWSAAIQGLYGPSLTSLHALHTLFATSPHVLLLIKAVQNIHKVISTPYMQNTSIYLLIYLLTCVKCVTCTAEMVCSSSTSCSWMHDILPGLSSNPSMHQSSSDLLHSKPSFALPVGTGVNRQNDDVTGSRGVMTSPSAARDAYRSRGVASTLVCDVTSALWRRRRCLGNPGDLASWKSGSRRCWTLRLCGPRSVIQPSSSRDFRCRRVTSSAGVMTSRGVRGGGPGRKLLVER